MENEENRGLINKRLMRISWKDFVRITFFHLYGGALSILSLILLDN